MWSPLSPRLLFPGLLLRPLSNTQPLWTQTWCRHSCPVLNHTLCCESSYSRAVETVLFLVHVALSNQALNLYSITQSTVMCFQATCSFLSTPFSFLTSQKFPHSCFASWLCSAQRHPSLPPLQGSSSNFHVPVLLWMYQWWCTPSSPSFPLRIQGSLSYDKLIFPPKSHYTQSQSLLCHFVNTMAFWDILKGLLLKQSFYSCFSASITDCSLLPWVRLWAVLPWKGTHIEFDPQ